MNHQPGIGSHSRTADDGSFGAAFGSYIIMIMPNDKSQECASNDKWPDKCCVVCVFDALVWCSQF